MFKRVLFLCRGGWGLFRLAVVALLVSAQVTVAEPAPAVPQELERLIEILIGEIQNINMQFRTAVSGLPDAYREDLHTLQMRMQRAGDLDGVLAVRNESQRYHDAMQADLDPFERTPEMPPEALVREPAALRMLQDQYLRNHEEHENVRRDRLDALLKTYISRLEDLQRMWTVQDRIPDALAVRNEIERVRKHGAVPPTDTRWDRTANDGVQAGSATIDDDPPVYGVEPAWTRWLYEGAFRFSQDGPLLNHPDLPDELVADYRRRLGQGRIQGHCRIGRHAVALRDRHWFGKALVWRISDPMDLNGWIHLESRFVSGGRNYGPSCMLILQHAEDASVLATLEFPMIDRKSSIRLTTDPETHRVILHWVEGRKRAEHTLTPGEPVRLVLGISVRNPGEQCDTRIELR